MAVEVLCDADVKFKNLDFNTGHATIYMNYRTWFGVDFYTAREDMIRFCLGGIWHIARFEGLIVRVKKDSDDMWWVGISSANRWQEPLFPEHKK